MIVVSWVQWEKELKRILVEEYSYDRSAVYRADWSCMRMYFDAGDSPADAIFNDINGGMEIRHEKNKRNGG